jgi:hypothetical protein
MAPLAKGGIVDLFLRAATCGAGQRWPTRCSDAVEASMRHEVLQLDVNTFEAAMEMFVGTSCNSSRRVFIQ